MTTARFCVGSAESSEIYDYCAFGAAQFVVCDSFSPCVIACLLLPLFARKARPRYNEMARPTTQRESIRLPKAFKHRPSVFATLASRASETKKGQRTPSIRGARGHRAAPDLSRQSACSACLERAARTTVSAIAGALSTKRAAPATSTLEHARRAHPALISQRSGPRQAPFRRRPF